MDQKGTRFAIGGLPKGSYGYIRSKKIWVAVWTVLLFAVSLSLYLIGLKVTGSNQNILTIVAVLGCLPAGKSIVNLVMFLKAHGCTRELKERIEPHAEGLDQLYDSVITAYEGAYEIPHLVYKAGNLVGIAVDQKCKVEECEKHIHSMCVQNTIKDVNIKIFRDEKKYLNRLDQLRDMESTDGKAEEVLALIKAISL